MELITSNLDRMDPIDIYYYQKSFVTIAVLYRVKVLDAFIVNLRCPPLFYFQL